MSGLDLKDTIHDPSRLWLDTAVSHSSSFTLRPIFRSQGFFVIGMTLLPMRTYRMVRLYGSVRAASFSPTFPLPPTCQYGAHITQKRHLSSQPWDAAIECCVYLDCLRNWAMTVHADIDSADRWWSSAMDMVTAADCKTVGCNLLNTFVPY